MKKTQFDFFIGNNNNRAVYRKVYEKDGRFYIKHKGAVVDVTDKQKHFVKF